MSLRGYLPGPAERGRRRARREGERAALALSLGSVLTLAFPTVLAGQESVTDIYKQVSDAWAANAAPFVIPIFFLLFIVDASLTFAESLETKGGPEEIFIKIGRRLAVGAVGVSLFLNPEYFSMPIIGAFERAGTAIGGGGVSGLPDPQILLLQGWDAFARLMGAIFIAPPRSEPKTTPVFGDITGIFDLLRDLRLWLWYIVTLGSFLIGVALSAIVVGGAFVIMALQVTLIKAQAYLLVSLGLFFVSALGSRWTEGMFTGYVRIILQAGTKLFLLASLFGVYYLLLPYWENLIVEGLAGIPRGPDQWGADVGVPEVSMQPLILVAVSCGLYAYLVWKIPGWFSEVLLREVHFSLSRGKGG